MSCTKNDGNVTWKHQFGARIFESRGGHIYVEAPLVKNRIQNKSILIYITCILLQDWLV